MKIAYNPEATALTAAPSNNDITFDLAGKAIYARGVKFEGTNTTYSVFKKHTSDNSGGYDGLVPVPSYTTTTIRYLREDGNWEVPIMSEAVTDLGTDGNYITWTKNNIVNKLTVPYATSAGALEGYTISNFMVYADHPEYVAASFTDENLSKKAAEKYIEYWDSAGWFNSAWGKVTANYGFVGNLTGTASYATSADNSDKLDNYHESDFFRYRGALYQKHNYDADVLGIGEYAFRSSAYGSVGTGDNHVNALSENSTILVFKWLQLSTSAWSDDVAYRVNWTGETNSNRPNGWSPWIYFLSTVNSSVSGGGSSGGSSITVNIGGTSKTLTIPTSLPANGGTADYINYTSRADKGNATAQFCQYSGETNNPTNDWYSHIIMNHNNSAGYYTEIATCFHSDSVYFRRQSNGTTYAWKTFAWTSDIPTVSNSNGYVPRFVSFPAYRDFGSSTDTYDYLQNIVKWIYDNANYGEKTYLMGVGNPNSLGMMNIQLYGASGKNGDGWPRYCSGTYLNLGDSAFEIFGTNNYNYYRYRLSVDGHSHRITKLHRRDSSDDYSLQHHWTGSYWYLRGYYGDSYHAGVQVDYAGYADSAGSANSVAWSNVSGRPDMNKYVPKNYNNIAYSDITAKYVGSSTPTYFRITFPDKVLSIWNMVNIEIFVRQSYENEYGGKILICTHNNSGNTWNPFRASTHGPLTTSIKVYGSEGKYLYIGGCGSYSTISIDKILIGDTATYHDISDISIDYVTSLPAAYQTATMYYDINSLNIGSQSVNYASSAGSVAWGNITGKPSSFTPSSHTHTYIESKANYTFTASTLPNSFDWGVSAGFVADGAGYGSYGSVLTVRTYTGGGGTLLLYAPYSNTYGGSRLKARFGNYDSNSGNSWTTLKEIAWTSDIPTVTDYYWANVKVSSTSSTSTYPTFANMKSTGRVYLDEWIQFSGGSGLYWPNNNGVHLYANTTTSFAGLMTQGARGGYCGLHCGPNTNYMTVMSTDTHHGLYCESTGWEFYYNRSNTYIGLRTCFIPYPITMDGDSYTTGWSRAASGFYVEGTGVHYTSQGSVGEINMTRNNEFVYSTSNGTLYFNYRGASRGTTVTNYIWNAGSSSSYASHVLGKVKAQSTASSWLDGQRYERAGFNLMDAADTESYWPWMRQTNTGSGKWYSMGVLSNSLYFIGSTTSRTDNGYDYGFRMDFSNGYLYGNFSGYLSGTASNVTCTEASGDTPRPIVGVVNNSLYYTSKVTIRWDNGNVTAPTFTGRLIGSADQVDGYHISVVTSLPSTKVNNTIYILV